MKRNVNVDHGLRKRRAYGVVVDADVEVGVLANGVGPVFDK
jgi:hypothetical protein